MTAAAAAQDPEAGLGAVCDETSLDRAAAGDSTAWDLLVDRHTGLLWAIARGHGLSITDAEDTVLTTWSLLVQQLDRIRERSPVGIWLATTARREALRRLARRQSQIQTTDHDIPDQSHSTVRDAGPQAAFLRAVDLLLPKQRLLLHVLSTEPRPTDDQISAAVNMPISEIPSARAHALHQLRQALTPADVRR